MHQGTDSSIEKSTQLETTAVQGLANEGTEGQGENPRNSSTNRAVVATRKEKIGELCQRGFVRLNHLVISTEPSAGHGQSQ
jgi:hypothetical protein